MACLCACRGAGLKGGCRSLNLLLIALHQSVIEPLRRLGPEARKKALETRARVHAASEAAEEARKKPQEALQEKKIRKIIEEKVG